ncbi:S8 family serine peptidase [Halovivax limisalsi]|uniref:S8 family serine peptidase n=1 Tax=Halovivax limisalsi TaxID=1453760 RepID=UPI001FFDB9EA|nr:S8 family serine peptidase [Halovivax limisalsi]
MRKDSNHGYERRSILKAAGAIGATVGISGITVATPGREPKPRENELLVGYAEGIGLDSARSIIEDAIPADAAVVHENDVIRYVAVEFPDADDAELRTQRGRLEGRDGIRYADRNRAVYAYDVQPNDPRFDEQYAPQQVNAPDAWETTMGSTDVTLAVLDTGVEYTHENIEARFGDDPGYDFGDDDEDPAPGPNEDHGTHVCGCAAATIDDGVGTAGIANCRLIAGRVLGGVGGGMDAVADGIQWAADEGADIINMSLGSDFPNGAIEDALAYALENDTLPIAAAGNEGTEHTGYPAAYEDCMAISALNEQEELADFSSYGPAINLASPGAQVLSSVPGGGYERFSGTSMASPVAAGVAALGKSAHPDLSAQELWDRLEETAVDIGLPEDHQGSGRVDAANIVEGGGGECSGETETTTESGYLAWWNDREDYTYATTTDSPCGIDIELEGPGSFANYDLYVTYDGRTPTTGDYDDRSAGSGPDEAISGSLSGTTDVGVLVHAAEGWGSYDLTITEQGQS